MPHFGEIRGLAYAPGPLNFRLTLEHEPKLSLEYAASDLLRELSPGNCRTCREVWVDGQIRHALVIHISRLRVIQHVERIHAELQALRFRHLERLREVRIESPDRQTLNDVLPQIPSLSRLRILENDQS